MKKKLSPYIQAVGGYVPFKACFVTYWALAKDKDWTLNYDRNNACMRLDVPGDVPGSVQRSFFGLAEAADLLLVLPLKRLTIVLRED